MPAEEAGQRQLVNNVYADKADMLAAVMDIAETIASKSPLSIRGTKQILNYSREHSIADGLDYIATWNAGMFLSDDITEAMTAKMTGRAAKFAD